MPTDTQELASLVKVAAEATKDLAEGHLRDIAFEKVLDHLLAGGGAASSLENRVPAPAADIGAAQQSSVPADGVLGDEQQRADAVARYFKIAPEQVVDIFDVSDQVPALKLRSTQLETPRAEATRQIALLITGVHTALGQETSTSDIKQATDEYSRLDGSNFMKTLTDMPELAVLGKRGSRNRIVRMKVRGAEEAQGLVQRLLD